jgi:hypothetical protein
MESDIGDFFDLGFVTLPHKILLPNEFTTQVMNFQSR